MTAAELKRLVDRFDWAKYNDEVRGEAGDIIGNVVNTAGQQGAERAGGKWDNEDPFVQKELTGYVGDLINSIDGTTRDAVKELVTDALESGDFGTPEELGDAIAELVQETFAGWADWRADTIARTETATAYNLGNLFGYRQAGVEEVEVSDGDEDEECAQADGQTWTLDEALANPVAHPNCERDFSPVLPGEAE